MVLLDASAVVALLGGEPAQAEIENLLRRGEAGLVPANLAEVVDVLMRRFGASEAALRERLDPLLAESLEVVAISGEHGWRAGELRARHYDRATRPLSLADCLLLACAGAGDEIATLDRDVAAVAKLEGIRVRLLQ